LCLALGGPACEALQRGKAAALPRHTARSQQGRTLRLAYKAQHATGLHQALHRATACVLARPAILLRPPWNTDGLPAGAVRGDAG